MAELRLSWDLRGPEGLKERSPGTEAERLPRESHETRGSSVGPADFSRQPAVVTHQARRELHTPVPPGQGSLAGVSQACVRV